MAAAVRRDLASDIGVGITGVAGPEPIDGTPVGEVHLGLVIGEQREALKFNFPQRREAVKRRAVTNALLLIRRALLAREAKTPG